MRLIRTVTSWIIALSLAFVLVQLTLHPFAPPPPGWVKFYDPPGEHIVFQTLARQTGAATFEPAGRLIAGVLELIAAAALILPFTRRFGAGLLTVIMGVGVLLHLSPWLGQALPRSTVLLAGGNDGGRAFFVTLGLFIGGVLLLIVQERPPSAAPKRY